RRGAGEADERGAAVGEHRLADGAAWADREIEHSGEAVAVEYAAADLVDGYGGERSLLGWFPNHAVATDGGDQRVPGPDGDGEVEGSTHAGEGQAMPMLV